MDSWDPYSDPRRLECVHIGPSEIRSGDRVRLHPRGRADIFDLALTGMTATVASIEQDFEGRVYLAVTVDDDPGKDLAPAPARTPLLLSARGGRAARVK